jgi:hypothetical protein
MIPGRRSARMRRPAAPNFAGPHDFHDQAKVLAVGRSDEHNRIAQAKPFRDIPANAWRRGRREGERRRVAQPLAGGAEPQVGRSEVVPPLRDAVRLVYTEKRRSSALEIGRGGPPLERLRRGEDDDTIAAFEPVERDATLGRTQSTVEHDDRDAVAPERALLIRHEGNQWRDDNGRPFEDHRRNLIDQRLSKAGRKRHERVVPLEDGDHRRFLLGPEPPDTERPARYPPAHIEQAHERDLLDGGV